MTATALNVDDLVARLHEKEAAVAVARKALNEKTAQSQAALQDTAQKLELAIGVLTSAPREIEAEQALITDLEDRRATVLTKQTELEQQIADSPDWRLAGDGHARDKEYDRQRTLNQQLQLLCEGSLLFAPNLAYARIEDLDARLKASHERIETLRARLDANVRQAEQLLCETVTS